MIELRTLGSLELASARSDAVASVLAQPRRAALLCYLAITVPRGIHRRDTLFALFWPEDDAEHARHALRQSVYFLRRALGSKTIVSRGDEELALTPDHVCCDAWAFEAAVDQALPYFESLTGSSLPSEYERGRIYEQIGQLKRAREAYALFLAPRQQADPVFQPMIQNARAALQRLAVAALE